MKKALLTLAVTLLFALSMMAQSSTPPASSDQKTPDATQQSTPSSDQKTPDATSNPQSDQSKPQADQSTATEHKHGMKGEHGKAMTGCVSGPNAEGNYVLTSKRGKTIELTGNDSLKDHVGHEVKVNGSWTTGESAMSATGDKNATSTSTEKNEAKEKHFKVDNVEMVSESCTKPSAKAKTPAHPGL